MSCPCPSHPRKGPFHHAQQATSEDSHWLSVSWGRASLSCHSAHSVGHSISALEVEPCQEPSFLPVWPVALQGKMEDAEMSPEQDLDKAQEAILKHQASISELKRNFMASTPEPRPSEWEKRRVTPLPFQPQASLEEEITSILFSGQGFSLSVKASFPSATTWTAEGPVVNANAPREPLSSSPFSHSPEVHFTSFPHPATESS